MPPPEEPKKTKKPANTAFKQQRLKAWQPILTPKTVLPTFFVVGAIFIPLGIGLFIASNKVEQVMFDYTQCKSENQTSFAKPNGDYGPITEWKWDNATSECTVRFEIPAWMNPPVFIYYRLTNFYQNHRRYVKSFDANQLKGNIPENPDSLTNCKPLARPDWANEQPIRDANGTELQPDANAQYYPCGLIANSLFSDSFSDLTCVQSDAEFVGGKRCNAEERANSNFIVYDFAQNDIAWPSDKDRFAKPSNINADVTKKLIPPPMWRDAFDGRFKNGYTVDNFPDLKTWEALQVWMRTAGLPNFRKLYGKNTGSALAPGIWELVIKDTFNVDNFSGTKSVVISQVSFIGGKNPFLGVAYLTVGAACWVLGILFLLRHMIKPRKLGDHTYLSWNQPQNRADQGGERTSLMNR